jgi:hypothetical protein
MAKSKKTPKSMSFGAAIEALKKGETVARKGWNETGAFIYLEDRVPEYEPHIVMAQEKSQPGWLPSQADILANDWEVQ